MSDNTHATAIKQAARDLAQGNIWATDRHIETIDHHAEALAKELAETNARATGMGDGEAAVPENEHITAINDVLERAWNPDNPAITTIREHVTALAESIADAEKQKLAYRSAMEEIEKTGRLWVPRHLRVYYNDVVCKIKRGAGVRGHE